MSVRITSDEHYVALFDSTSGVAFGPVFPSSFDAELFLQWMDSEGLDDPRSYSDRQLSRYQDEWEQQRDGDKTDTEQFGAGSA